MSPTCTTSSARLAQGQQLDGLILDLDLQGVDAAISGHCAFGGGAVAPGDRFDGGGKLGFRHPAHLRHQGGQNLQLFVEGLDGMINHFLSRSGAVPD